MKILRVVFKVNNKRRSVGVGRPLLGLNSKFHPPLLLLIGENKGKVPQRHGEITKP